MLLGFEQSLPPVDRGQQLRCGQHTKLAGAKESEGTRIAVTVICAAQMPLYNGNRVHGNRVHGNRVSIRIAWPLHGP